MKQITRTGQFSFRVWRKPEETHSKLLVWPSYFHPLNYHQVWSLYPNGRSKRFEEFCSFNKQWTGSGHKTDSKQNPSNPLLHVQEFLSLIGFMQCTGYSFISTTFWMRVIKCVLYTFVPNIIKLLLLLYIELTISFLIGQKCTVNFWNQRLWRHLAADYTLIMSRTLIACRAGEIFSSERSHRKKFSRHLEFFMQWKTGERKKVLPRRWMIGKRKDRGGVERRKSLLIFPLPHPPPSNMAV